MKLQEAPDMVPVGELPRHLIIFGDRCVLSLVYKVFTPLRPNRYLTSAAVPGSRVIATGIYSTFNVGRNVWF
jgi:DNA replication licensing factor MCM5